MSMYREKGWDSPDVAHPNRSLLSSSAPRADYLALLPTKNSYNKKREGIVSFQQRRDDRRELSYQVRHSTPKNLRITRGEDASPSKKLMKKGACRRVEVSVSKSL